MKITWIVFLAGPMAVCVAQSPTPPPMKMGLWEKTVEVTMPGLDSPQGSERPAGRPAVILRSCFTPETWQRRFSPGPEHTDCVRSNESWTAQKYSVDISCNQGAMTEHYERAFESREKGQEIVRITRDRGNGNVIHADSKSVLIFVSSDCGTTKSGVKVVAP